jgi:hypothetical protein
MPVPERLKSRNLASKNGLPGGIRTLDHLLRRQMLYPAELQGDFSTGKFYDNPV